MPIEHSPMNRTKLMWEQLDYISNFDISEADIDDFGASTAVQQCWEHV